MLNIDVHVMKCGNAFSWSVCVCGRFHSAIAAPPRSAQGYSAPPHQLLFWNVYILHCVFRQADIGSPIIGWSVVKEKLLFIGPLCIQLKTFLTRSLWCREDTVLCILRLMERTKEWVFRMRGANPYVVFVFFNLLNHKRVCLWVGFS